MLTVRLDKCIPLEPCVAEPKYRAYRERIAAGAPLPPVRGVLVDDGCYLITDGSHRCKAAVDAGWTEIDLEIDTRKWSSFVRVPDPIVDLRRDQKLQGFTTLPVVSDAEFAASTREDKRNLSFHSMWKKLKHLLPMDRDE